MEERNVEPKGEKSSKQGQTIAKDLSLLLPDRRFSPYHRIDKITELTYSLIYRDR